MDIDDLRSRAELLAAIKESPQPSYVFFWGHRPRDDGQPGVSCFSQWWEGAPFTAEGELYATAEHWMMAEKARLFADREALGAIISSADPSEAKRLGRGVRGFDRERWGEVRFEAVVRGNLAKFSQHPCLAAALLETRGGVLVEASPLDPIWGIGLAADDPDASKPEAWRGQNLLGFALMEVRSQLTKSQRPGASANDA